MCKRSVHCKAEKLQRKAVKSEKLQALQRQQQLEEHELGLSIQSIKQANRGKHNCSWKDAGATHIFNGTICLRKRHCGYCPHCGVLAHYEQGCIVHVRKNAKKDNLIFQHGLKMLRIVAANRAAAADDEPEVEETDHRKQNNKQRQDE